MWVSSSTLLFTTLGHYDINTPHTPGKRIIRPPSLMQNHNAVGAAVAEWCECLPSTEENPVQSPAGSPLACGYLTERCRWSGWGKRETIEKTRRPTASSGTIPTCENPVTRPGIETGSPWWERACGSQEDKLADLKPGNTTACSRRVENEIRENGAAPECVGRGKREIPEKTRRPEARFPHVKIRSNPAGD
ncbi:hypothetical protein PR048_006108 [Dryococelus australis]|uniref:Uncharacterized protein n=1 Tax=Dryococelus australis TaxID=614101 RepID=A0ABQ9IA16_9NEOP|nr:hypothetical protein PR048_006108 [Dryococelus australis]